jgi:Na+/H+ antiporter NhaC
MFLQTIPNNLYALLTIVMCLTLAIGKFDYGPMKIHEDNARDRNDLFTTPDRPYGEGLGDVKPNANGKVIDLVLPVVVLIFCCIMGMVYTGGFFDGESFIDAFAGSDASMGLVLGSVITLILTFIYYMIRRVMTFQEFTECIPDGFKQMVPAILILTFAWTLSGMTGLLGGATFVENLVANAAPGMKAMLPAIVFLVCVGLAFATGTSWGTFGIMIPIVLPLFPPGQRYDGHLHRRLPGRRRLRRPLLSHLRHHHHASAAPAGNHVNMWHAAPLRADRRCVCFVGLHHRRPDQRQHWITLIISLVCWRWVLFALKSITTKKDAAAVVK